MPNLRFASWFLCKGTKKMNKLCKSFDFNLLLILKKDGFAKPTWQIMFNSELCSMWKLETNMQNSLVNLNDWLMFRKRLTLEAFCFIPYCQENSEFCPLKTGYFLKWKRFWGEKRQKSTFSEVVDYQRLPFSWHFFDAWKRCFWVVKAMLWASHLWQMSGSYAANDTVKGHKWHPQRPQMTKLPTKSEGAKARK